METITLAGGCFWCTEAAFRRLKGVFSVTPGYANGHVPHPTYEQVCSGRTGHAEAVQIEFDPTVITLADILSVFWLIHDPTSLNRQGNDVGPQYRSAIFCHTPEQLTGAQQSRAALEQTGVYRQPIVTVIEPLTSFYPAEDYHREYFDSHPEAPYCRLVIDPKLRKLLAQYDTLIDTHWQPELLR